jgi:proteasome lid subunit RPN8/RPN11
VDLTARSRKNAARDSARAAAAGESFESGDASKDNSAVPDVSDPNVIERDIAAIRSIEWPQRPLVNVEGFRDSGFQVVFHQSVLDAIHLHGQSITDIEVCGVLIGNGYNDSNGPYLLIEHCIRGIESRGQSTNVTFTAETWQHIQEKMDRDYPTKKMVGWYHTHPGFGIFLSGMDQFICDNFFNLPWQVAFVYDPISGEEGNFVWRSAKTRREPVLIEDDVTPKAAAVPLISVAEATRADDLPAQLPLVGDEKVIELLERVRRLEKRQKLMIIAMAFMAAFVAYFTPMSVPGVKPATMPAEVNPATTPPAAPAVRPAIPGLRRPTFDPTTQPML